MRAELIAMGELQDSAKSHQGTGWFHTHGVRIIGNSREQINQSFLNVPFPPSGAQKTQLKGSFCYVQQMSVNMMHYFSVKTLVILSLLQGDEILKPGVHIWPNLVARLFRN